MRRAFLVVCVLGAGVSGDAWSSGLRAGKVSGVVVEAGSGRPIPGAIAIVRWKGYFPQGRGDVCVRSVAVRTDAAGRFEIGEWQQEKIFGNTAYFDTRAYAPGYAEKVHAASKGGNRFTPFNDVRVPGVEGRSEMVPFGGDHAARLELLQRLLSGTDCRDGDATRSKDFYLAVREEFAAMPPEIGNYRPSPSRSSPIEMVDGLLASIGVDIATLPQVPLVKAPVKPVRIEAEAPRRSDSPVSIDPRLSSGRARGSP